MSKSIVKVPSSSEIYFFAFIARHMHIYYIITRLGVIRLAIIVLAIN